MNKIKIGYTDRPDEIIDLGDNFRKALIEQGKWVAKAKKRDSNIKFVIWAEINGMRAIPWSEVEKTLNKGGQSND